MGKGVVGDAAVPRDWAQSIGAKYASNGVEALNVAARICLGNK